MSFGLDKMTAEDIVQNMYIKIHGWSEKNKDKTKIMYNKDEVNYYFVFKTLRTLFYDYTRKVSRRTKHSEKPANSLS